MKNNNLFNSVQDQLDNLLEDFKSFALRSKHKDFSDLNQAEIMLFITSSRAAIHRVSSALPIYEKQVEEIMNMKTYLSEKALLIGGVVLSLSKNLKSGYIESVKELIHAELFSNFLEMSEHLEKEGYKDAAAVIAGSALEAHLRQLCIKNNIEIEYENKGTLHPKKADRMNSDLVKEKVYNKTVQKNVTSWLGIRNDAAHGHYENYYNEQVAIMISAIRDFMTKNPA